ncbi:MAG: ABC transporter ATP-binding protein [Phycisphaera sp.]|nr:ABC transporter ATP-binding protein [Phycisphaera sp.]
MRPRVRAVEDLSLEIMPHEIFGLLGPNGSGKSTTIKMILGLLNPTRGRLVVFGKSPSDVETKKRIGYLPEESYLYPFLNARETLDYYAKLFELDVKTRTRRIDELLDMVGLSAAQHRPVREYSKGMQRRIGLAQALINDPDFLILDEPTTGLDPIGTRQVKDLIIELGRRGKTVLLSSHLLSDVEDVVDRMVILYGGKIRDEGTTDSLLTKHSKTTLETDVLDDETIAEIDQVIRRRSGGAKSLLAVTHPRQKLEEKFLEIVQKAKAERVETSGASGDGATASFLAARTDDETSGEELIDKLVSAEPESMPAAEKVTAKPAARVEPERNVVDDLVAADEPEPSPAPAPKPASAAQSETSKPSAPRPVSQTEGDVDLDVISSLLDDTEKPGNGGGSTP